MNPGLLLSLWRERWGKAAGTTFKVPYAQGKINQWTYWLPNSAVWSVPGVPTFALFLCILLIGLMTSVGLSFNSQVFFSVFFLCIAVWARRYVGALITLVLAGMAMIASTRYLYWRFDATLVPDFTVDFIFGFYLFVAECYLALLVSVGLAQSIWPLKRKREPLSHEQNEWPTVDIFILCYDQPYAAIKLTSIAAYTLDWPRNKIRTYLIDGGQRHDLQALAESIEAHYLPQADDSGGYAGLINLALPSAKGDLIAVFESGQSPDKSFLKSTVGWFLRDQTLGMIQTPYHFLTPSPSKHDFEVLNKLSFDESCVLLRRSVVIELGGFDTTPVTEQSHFALKLQNAGYGCAYIGFDRRERLVAKGKNWSVEPKIDLKSEVFLVEHPFFGRTLRWKQRIASFHDVLQFYYPAPRLLFFIAPVVYFLGCVQIIQASPELFAAYALPHFVHAHIVRARTHGKNRFTLFSDIRETVLAWYMLVATLLTLLRTEFAQSLDLLLACKSNRNRTTSPITVSVAAATLHYIFVMSLNLAGFFGGIASLLFFGTNQRELTVLYLLWSAYNILLLAATLALFEEAKQVRKYTRSRLQMPAMIKLSSGRTVSCATENFPESALGLSLPVSVAVEVGSPVSISIFHGHQELVFPAMVVLRQDLTLRVRIADAARNNYQTFAVGVLSRGPEWPKWLPGRDADRPFPKWVTDTFTAMPAAVLDFATNISKHLHWARTSSWVQLWKKRND